jgi:isocitrate dehydrogenase (NAD+)
MTDIVVIEGDGIGPEVVDAAKQCLKATDADIAFSNAAMGQDAIGTHGTPLPDETVEAIRSTGYALKGPVKTPVGGGFRSVNVELRKRLELYANIRPCRYMPGVPSRIDDPDAIDIVVVRENLEDVYAGIEFEEGSDDAKSLRDALAKHGFRTRDDSGYSVKPISRTGSERVIRHAFEYAEDHGREKVTVVDKSNIMKYTDGLFMRTGDDVADDYNIDHEHLLVDNMAQQLVVHPEQFDVIVSQNLYGDILSDLTAGLVGGVGMIPSANIGDEAAVFASVHGTAPDIAGENRANPTAVILSAAMLLDHIGEEQEADRVRGAVRSVVAAGNHVTADLGGDASTDEMTAAILDAMDA